MLFLLVVKKRGGVASRAYLRVMEVCAIWKGTQVWLLMLFSAYGSHELCGQETDRPEQQTYPFRMNSVGYLPEALKHVSIGESQKPFQVIRIADQKVVLEGTSSDSAYNPDTEEELSTIDLSAVREPGKYRLEVIGLGPSPDFSISADVYNQAFYTAVRAMYLARCGMAVSGKHGDNIYSHEACHLHDAQTDFVGADNAVSDAVGGWHDAGDYNKYVVNAGITVGMMLQAWEHFPERLERVNFHLPESNNSIPDYLDEIRWEMEWVLKTQLVDGSVSHKVTTKKFGGFIAPEAEQADRYFTPWGSAATADFVAMTAATSRVFAEYDGEFADKCLSAAKKSHRFLLDHPRNHPANQAGFFTGGYETDDSDDRLWAAAELWQSTGGERYLKDFEQRVVNLAKKVGEKGSVVDFSWDWSNVGNLGMFTYVRSNRPGRSAEVLARVQRDIVKTANEVVATAAADGYGRPLGNRYSWGCNGTVARLAMVLQVAETLEPNPKYRQAALAALDHLLGRNYYGRSFVTGIGFMPPRFPHDRRQGINGFADPWPGYLVGGGWPTARDWHDDQEDYKTNEIAINWNGALIYALAGFVEPDGFDQVMQKE